MPTITALEDCLRDSAEMTKKHLRQMTALRGRLQGALLNPVSREEYQSIALLLDAVNGAENIIKTIYFRYHNKSVEIDEMTITRD